jgi:hypothetical protein
MSYYFGLLLWLSATLSWVTFPCQKSYFWGFNHQSAALRAKAKLTQRKYGSNSQSAISQDILVVAQKRG